MYGYPRSRKMCVIGITAQPRRRDKPQDTKRVQNPLSNPETGMPPRVLIAQTKPVGTTRIWRTSIDWQMGQRTFRD